MDQSRAAHTTGTAYPELKLPPLAGTQPQAPLFAAAAINQSSQMLCMQPAGAASLNHPNA